MRLSEWRDRLTSETTLEVKRVADLASARGEHRRDTVYVMYSADDAPPNEAETIGAVRQLHTVGVDVIYAITNRRSSDGDEAVEEIELAREQVQGALADWEPPSGDSAVSYRRGRVLKFTTGTLWWQDSFEVAEFRASVTERIYRLAASEPPAPTGGQRQDLDEHVPDGWSRSKPDPTETEMVWQATRTATINSNGLVFASRWALEN